MTSAEDLKRQARRHEASGRFDRAVECYERALERVRKEGPEGSSIDTSLYLSLADLHFRQGEVESALEHYRAAADQYARSGMAQNAISVHKMSRRLFPERPEPYVHLADLYLRSGNEAKAREQVRELTERMEKSEALTRGAVARVAGRYRENGSNGLSNPGLLYIMEEAGCFPAETEEAEWEPADPEPESVKSEPAGRSGEPVEEADEEPAADEDEVPAWETQLEEDLESLKEFGRQETVAERRSEDEIESEEGSEWSPPEVEDEMPGEETEWTAAEAEDETSEEEDSEDEKPFSGWDFLEGLRPSRRSRPSRPQKSDREEETPEYASTGATSEQQQAAEEQAGEPEDPVPTDEDFGTGGPRDLQAEVEEASEEETADGPTPHAEHPENGTDAGPEILEPEADEGVSGEDRSGLQSAAPVEEDGPIRRSRRWNWPPPEADEEEAAGATGESDRDEAEERRWTAEPSHDYEPAASSDYTDSPDQEEPQEAAEPEEEPQARARPEELERAPDAEPRAPEPEPAGQWERELAPDVAPESESEPETESRPETTAPSEPEGREPEPSERESQETPAAAEPEPVPEPAEPPRSARTGESRPATAWPPAPEGESAAEQDEQRSGARRPAAELRRGLEIVEDMLELRPGSQDLLRRKAAYARRLGEESLLVESWLQLGQSLRGRDGSRGARLLALRVLEMTPESRAAREMLRPVDQAVSSTSDVLDQGLAGQADRDADGADRGLRKRVAREFADEVNALRWLEAATEVALLAEEELPEEFFHYFGRYLMANGRWEDAGSMLERAAGNGEGPNAAEHPELVFSLALIYRRVGRHDQAVECFRRLAEVEESFATAWRALPESGEI